MYLIINFQNQEGKGGPVMKKLYGIILPIVLTVAPWWPETAVSQYWDDVYIRPSTREEIQKKQKERAQQEQAAAKAKAEKIAAATQNNETDYETFVPDSLWNVDAYNRRYAEEYIASDAQTSGNMDDVDAYNRRSSSQGTTSDDTSYIEDEGYYLNGFYGTQSDLEYAERIRKFHNPRFTIHITDPAYTDIYYLNSWDWNVYVDGTYAYVTPTWTNPWYWDYMWSPYSYWGPSWRWHSYYWGWGYPYYGFGWGWSYPHYHYYHHYYPHYRPQRPPHRPDYRPHPSTRPSYSPGGWNSRRPNQSVSRPSNSNDNRIIINSQNQRVRMGNTSRSSQRQNSTRQIETQRSYNRSYSPSYNNSSSRGSSISSGSSNSSRGNVGSGSRGGGGGGSRSRR